MRKYIFLALFSAIGVSCTQPFTADDLGKNVFESLKNNDADALMKCIVNEDDVSYFENNGSLSAKDKSRLVRKVTFHASKWKNNYTSAFNKIISSPYYNAIDWPTAVYDKTENDFNLRGGVEQSDMHVIFHDKNGIHVVVLDDCIKTNRGWVLMDEVQFDD